MRLGPVTILRSSTADAYREVARTAWPLHTEIWFYGENVSWPEGLKRLPALDAALADALSQVPVEEP